MIRKIDLLKRGTACSLVYKFAMLVHISCHLDNHACAVAHARRPKRMSFLPLVVVTACMRYRSPPK